MEAKEVPTTALPLASGKAESNENVQTLLRIRDRQTVKSFVEDQLRSRIDGGED